MKKKRGRIERIRNIINIILVLITLFVFSIGTDSLEIIICIIFFGIFFSINLFLILYDKIIYIKKENKNIVKKCFKYSKKIEVVPIVDKNWKYSSYFSRLTDVAKFYAVFDEKNEKIEIWLQDNNKKNEHFIEEIELTYFFVFYNIVEKK